MVLVELEVARLEQHDGDQRGLLAIRRDAVLGERVANGGRCPRSIGAFFGERSARTACCRWGDLREELGRYFRAWLAALGEGEAGGKESS
jgi:hypothetical protein